MTNPYPAEAVERLTSAINHSRDCVSIGYVVVSDGPTQSAVTDLAALLSYVEGMKWRPISEAPRDGTNIIAICADAYSPAPQMTWWQDGWMKMSRPEKFVVSWEPTQWGPSHWLLLPPPPDSEGVK